MSLSMVAPGVADLAFVDELVSISMHGTTVVVRPTRDPSALGTQVFIDVVNAATVAGSTVVLQSPGALVDSTVAVELPVANGVALVEPVTAEAVGIGLVSVRSEGAVWTIDLGSDRFMRSDRRIDRWLLVASEWTAFEALWIAPQFVRALTTDGSYVTGRRAWRPAWARDVRRKPLLVSRTA